VDVLGDKYVDIVGEPPESVFYISAPVIDEANRLIGGISVGLSTDQLVRRISNQALSTIIIYDDQGVLLAETLRASDNAVLMMDQSEYQDIYTTVENDSPIDEFEVNGNPYQVMYVPFYLRSEHIGVMGVALPTNFLVEQTATGRTFLAGLFSALFVTVIIVGILTARTITRPVSRLIDTTRAIREGDLSRRVQLRVPDELGELGLSFDHMTDELVSSYQRISTLYDTQVTETARREAVLASIGDPVIVLDDHGKTIFRNRAAGQMIDEAKRATNWAQIIDRMLGQASTLVENPQRVYMGDNIFDVIATPVLIDEENTLGHVIVFRNLTAILRAEQMKDQLMAQMSHELRTPMTAVRGYVDLVRMIDLEKLSESGADFLEKAVEGMSAMESMLNQVVDVNAMMANRFNILPADIDLVEIIPSQLEEWRPRLEKKSQSFEIIVEVDELQVLADPIYITQVVDHLMSNAWNYTLREGSITAVLKREGDHAVFSIKDTGVGISEEEIGQIYDRMFRGGAAQAGDTDSRGLGLGLYISKNIIDAHHGAIEVRSERHVGTTATVKLPLQVV
ncbi:MAG: cell wall metabolism sensor histidine kinase WalK, partial [Chloroflexi bacterium]|nr:cell wall metabolism sensor histidine kinase WalK [Chloroflexota bacterium]